MPSRGIGIVPPRLAKRRPHLVLRPNEYNIQQIRIDILLRRYAPWKLLDELIHLAHLRLRILRSLAFSAREGWCRRNLTGSPQVHICPGRVINLRLWKDRKNRLIRNQHWIGVRIPRRQMNQSAVDKPLKRIRTPYALDHSLANTLARILHLLHSSSKRNTLTWPHHSAIEFQFQRGSLMANAQSHLVSASNHAFDRRSH